MLNSITLNDLEDYQPLKDYMNTLVCSCNSHPDVICPIHNFNNPRTEVLPFDKYDSLKVSFCDCKVGKCSHQPISELLEKGVDVKFKYINKEGKECYGTLKPED